MKVNIWDFKNAWNGTLELCYTVVIIGWFCWVPVYCFTFHTLFPSFSLNILLLREYSTMTCIKSSTKWYSTVSESNPLPSLSPSQSLLALKVYTNSATVRDDSTKTLIRLWSSSRSNSHSVQWWRRITQPKDVWGVWRVYMKIVEQTMLQVTKTNSRLRIHGRFLATYIPNYLLTNSTMDTSSTGIIHEFLLCNMCLWKLHD